MLSLRNNFDAPLPDAFSQPDWGRLVRTRREKLGWSQANLAQRAGVSYQTIQNLEGGKRISKAVCDRVEAAFYQPDVEFGPAPKVPLRPAPGTASPSRQAALISYQEAVAIVFREGGEAYRPMLDKLLEAAGKLMARRAAPDSSREK